MCSTNCANTLFVSPKVQVKIAFSKTRDKTPLFCNSPSKAHVLPRNKHQMKNCYLLHNSSDITEEVTLQSELACVSYAITRLRAVSSHSSCTAYHQQESMPLKYFGYLFPFFLVPPYFLPLFHYFLKFFLPPPFSLSFFQPNFIASEFPSNEQPPRFPSAFSFFS